MLAVQNFKSPKSNESPALKLHHEAVTIAKNYFAREAKLLEVIARVEKSKIYFDFELTSLEQYCIELLGLIQATAKNFIAVLKASIEVPALAEAIYSGRTTVSKARKICSVVNEANAKEWIDLDRLSQKERRAVSAEEALFILMIEAHEKNDPILKAERAKARGVKEKAIAANSSKRSRYLPAEVRHAVVLRDRGQCVHVNSNGKRCENKRWTDQHHIKEFASGGEHAAENLETLCWVHHRMRHTRH
jgi:5-methylcytosine-specific restriction endonuclease McrA